MRQVDTGEDIKYVDNDDEVVIHFVEEPNYDPSDPKGPTFKPTFKD